MSFHQRWVLRQVRATRLALAEGQLWRARYGLAGSVRLRPVITRTPALETQPGWRSPDAYVLNDALTDVVNLVFISS